MRAQLGACNVTDASGLAGDRVVLVLGLAILACASAPTPSAAQAVQPSAAVREVGQQDAAERMLLRLREAIPPPQIALEPPPADLKRIDGTWVIDQIPPLHRTHDASGHEIQMTDAGRRILETRQKAHHVDQAPIFSTGTMCLPPGQPWQFGLISPFQILQTDDSVTFVFSEYHTVWSLPLNAASPTTGPRQYMGQSAGRWEGNTLVVETSAYKLPLWLEPDGMAASKDALVTMRIRRVGADGSGLEIATTIDDAKMFRAPWTYLSLYAWRPDFEVFEEYDCEQRAAENLKSEKSEAKN